MDTWAFAPSMIPTNSERNPLRTAKVAINAKTAKVIPTRLIHVMTLTPPSLRRDLR